MPDSLNHPPDEKGDTQVTQKKKVIFVCLGNICRSPAGEGVLRKFVADRQMDKNVEVDSAGTMGYHVGEPADPRMCQAAERRGYRLHSVGRQFESTDFEGADLVIAMDQNNLADLFGFDPGGKYRQKIRLLCEFIPECHMRDVIDPYYGGPEGFDRVIDLCEAASPHILDYLGNGHAH